VGRRGLQRHRVDDDSELIRLVGSRTTARIRWPLATTTSMMSATLENGADATLENEATGFVVSSVPGFGL